MTSTKNLLTKLIGNRIRETFCEIWNDWRSNESVKYFGVYIESDSWEKFVHNSGVIEGILDITSVLFAYLQQELEPGLYSISTECDLQFIHSIYYTSIYTYTRTHIYAHKKSNWIKETKFQAAFWNNMSVMKLVHKSNIPSGTVKREGWFLFLFGSFFFFFTLFGLSRPITFERISKSV